MSDVPVNIPTRQESVTKTREALRRNLGTVFFALAEDIPHDVYYNDNQRVFVGNGANWDEYVFKRGSGNKPDDGEWLFIATTSTSLAW